jgi:hypothetical protein
MQGRCEKQFLGESVVTAVATLFLALVCLQPVGAEDIVEFTRGNTSQTISGRIIIEADDGGVLLESHDGLLWSIDAPELKSKTTNDKEFVYDSREKLAAKLLEELPAGFKIHNTAHYIVCYNTSEDYAEWCGGLHERLYRAFTNYWENAGLELRDPELPLVALVFKDQATYARYSRPELGDATEAVIGYYSMRTNRVTMYDLTGLEKVAGGRSDPSWINQILSQPEATKTVATIIHEATHQLACNCGLQERFADIPLWVSEGLAVYFETPDLKSSRGWRTIGSVSRGRLLTFRRYLAGNRGTDSLKTLIADDRRFRNSETAAEAYAEAWALNFFLLKKYRTEYLAYLKQLTEKRPYVFDTPEERLAAFRAAFGDIDDFDREFVTAIRRLKL